MNIWDTSVSSSAALSGSHPKSPRLCRGIVTEAKLRGAG